MALTAPQKALLLRVVEAGRDGLVTEAVDTKVLVNLKKKGAVRFTKRQLRLSDDAHQRHVLWTGHAPRPRHEFHIQVLDGAEALV